MQPCEFHNLLQATFGQPLFCSNADKALACSNWGGFFAGACIYIYIYTHIDIVVFIFQFNANIFLRCGESPRERNRRAEEQDSSSAGSDASRRIRRSSAFEHYVQSETGREPAGLNVGPKCDGLYAQKFASYFDRSLIVGAPRSFFSLPPKSSLTTPLPFPHFLVQYVLIFFADGCVLDCLKK